MPLEILNIEDTTARASIPFSDGGVKAGFPSPAQDYMDQTIDFNRELITHKATTFCTRVSGDSMIDAYIHDGDYLIVDRSLEPRHDDMAVCFIDGEFTLKYVEVRSDGSWLRPANPDYPSIKVDPESDFTIWGVVTYSIHKRR